MRKESVGINDNVTERPDLDEVIPFQFVDLFVNSKMFRGRGWNERKRRICIRISCQNYIKSFDLEKRTFFLTGGGDSL